jgi:predicted DNA-binding transcriptional regulator YafY
MVSGMASAELLLHPVRLRIVQAFAGDRTLTTAQLAAELGDVSHASLYRHVALLTKAGVLQVAAERRVRAVVERTYMLRVHAAQIQPDEVAAMTPEQHLAAFMAYTAGMLSDAERYLMTGTPDPLRDGASYRMGAMWLTDTEFADLVRDIQKVFLPRLANAPGEGRRRRIVYSVLLPAPEASQGRAGGAKNMAIPAKKGAKQASAAKTRRRG